MSNLKRVKVILSSLERQGAQLKATKKGWFIMFPNGSSATVHKSESDPRAEANTRSRVLRAGLTWPFDGERGNNAPNAHKRR